MRRITLHEPFGYENLRLSVGEQQAPQQGEIQVRIRATSLNKHDEGVITGRLPTRSGLVPMSDAAGEVVGIGAGVRRFKIGDRVISTFFPRWRDGAVAPFKLSGVPGDHEDGFAEDVVTRPEDAFTPMPANYSFAEAATLPCAALTAWRSVVVEGQVKPGDSVLVLGTGGVSIFALQFARLAGATVFATTSSTAKADYLLDLGAHQVVNYRDEEQWGKSILKATGNRGVDHVIEVGGPGTLEQSLIAARPGGHVSVIGVLTGRAGRVPTALVMAKQLRVIGVGVGNHEHQRSMVRALEASDMRPVIDRVFPLEGIADAFRYQDSGQHVGKIVIDYDLAG